MPASGDRRWTDRLPLLAQLRGATPRTLLDDAAAGVLVTAIAVPLSIGFAEVAGVPPVLGLYTCLLPLAGFALLGSSRHLKLGLDAASAAMFAAALAPLAVSTSGDPARYLSLVALLTTLVGVLTLAAGLLRLGALGQLLSLPVLVGYQAGIALSVVVGQLPKLLGTTASGDNDVLLAVDVVRSAVDTHALTLAVSVAALGAVRLLRRTRPAVPAALLVLVAATAVSALLDLGTRGVAVVGDLPSGLPVIGLPVLSLDDVLALLGPAAAIALVTSADVVATSRAFAARLRYRVDPSQDLVGLGAANVLSALSGGLSTSASYARTAIAERTGSRSQLSSLVAALTMGAVLLWLTEPLAQVPRAVLAAVVVDAVLGLVDPKAFRRLFTTRRGEFLIAVFTAVGVLTLGLLWTLAAAVAWSVALLLRRLTTAEHNVLERRSGGGWEAVRDGAPLQHVPGVLVFRWDAPLFFGNAAAFRARLLEELDAACAHRSVDWVVLDGAAVSELDASAAVELEMLAEELSGRGITTAVVEPDSDERRLLLRHGFGCGEDPRGLLFDRIDDAVAARRARRST